MKRMSIAVALILMMGCSEKSTKLLPLPDPAREVKKEDLGEYVPFNPYVDILFVIDDSGSMMDHQKNLADNIDFFIDGISQNRLLDWHVGVINSSCDSWSGSGNCGKLLGGYVDKNTPNYKDVMRANFQVGTNGSATEIFFEPISKAITPPNLTGSNAGFFRPDALLAVFIITDTEDQGRLDANQIFQELVKFKGDMSKVTGYAVLADKNNPSCSGESETPTKIRDFIRLVQGQEFSLCDPQYGQNLAKIGSDVLDKVEMSIPLKQVPVVSTLKVSYGSQVIPNDPETGWFYDVAKNAIIFSRNLELKEEPAGTRLQVFFVPAEIQ